MDSEGSSSVILPAGQVERTFDKARSFTVIPAMKDPDSKDGRSANVARRWRKRLAQPQPESDSQGEFFSPPSPPKRSGDELAATAPGPTAPAPVEEVPTDPELTTDQAEALR